MSIKHISSAWKTNMLTGFPRDLRFYSDFRQQEYPPLSISNDTYTLITSAENRSGSHDMTGGDAGYLLDLPSTLTVRAVFRPEFVYTVATDQTIWSWYVSATVALQFFYQASSDTFVLQWQDGGTARTLSSLQFDDGAAEEDIDQDLVFDASIDLTTGDTSGSALYYNRASQDTTWSGAIDTKTTSIPILTARAQTDGTQTADVSLNQVIVIPSFVATAAQVLVDYKGVKDEQIVWHFNGHGQGHTRCNITARTTDFEFERSVVDQTGRRGANVASIQLTSPAGEFADDQYAAFDPANEVYNGLAAQAYMQHRCPIEVESWYSNGFELMISGRTDDSRFGRRTQLKDVSRVQVNILDGTDELARKVVRSAVTYEDYTMSNTASEATSLVHTLARLSTQKQYFNYLANSSFANATIGNSWSDDTNVTLARAAGGLFDSFEGQASTTGAGEDVFQIVTFTGTKTLNLGETWTFSIMLKAGATLAGSIILEERDASAANDSTSTAYSLTANANWTKHDVAHTITDATSDRLSVYIRLTTTGQTLSMDAAMLTQTDVALNWVVLNNNDGAAGVESADDADSAAYDTIGFDVDTVAVVHPWLFLPMYSSPWRELGKLADGTLALYMGFDAAGTLVYRSRLATGYSDPSSLETLATTRDLTTILEQKSANSIVIGGTRIDKQTNLREVWNAAAAGHFTADDGGHMKESIANGATWPPSTEYGEYWAQYGEGAPLAIATQLPGPGIYVPF